MTGHFKSSTIKKILQFHLLAISQDVFSYNFPFYTTITVFFLQIFIRYTFVYPRPPSWNPYLYLNKHYQLKAIVNIVVRICVSFTIKQIIALYFMFNPKIQNLFSNPQNADKENGQKTLGLIFTNLRPFVGGLVNTVQAEH